MPLACSSTVAPVCPSCVLKHSPLRVTACPGTAPPALPAQPSCPQSHASHLVAGAGEEDRSRTGAGQEQDRSRTGAGQERRTGHKTGGQGTTPAAHTYGNAYAKGPQRAVAQHSSCTTPRDSLSAPNQQTQVRPDPPPSLPPLLVLLPGHHTPLHPHSHPRSNPQTFCSQHPPDSMGEIALGRPSSGPARLT